MAVCVMSPQSKEAVRVSKEKAAELVAKGWIYIGKHEFQRMLEAAEKRK